MKISNFLQISLLFLVAALISAVSVPQLYKLQGNRQFESKGAFETLPTEMVRALSLEFHGFAADYLLMQTMTYLGKRVGTDQKLTPEEGQRVYGLLGKITDLDPKFWDPYLLAESFLTWEGGMFDQAKGLLLKAAKYRPNDYRPYYFIGFNAFFFQKDNAQAAKYIGLAAKRPGAPWYLAGLAARLDLYSNHTDVAIVFLEEMLTQTSEPKVRSYIEQRLATLKIIYQLEKRVAQYKQTYGILPSSLQDLVQKGLLNEIPKDPYGGEFFLIPNIGRVYSTSKLVLQTK